MPAITCNVEELGVPAYTADVATFGEKVTALREHQGWTQVELARRATIHVQTVNDIEHGRNKGGLQSRSKLARAFGISLAELDEPQEEQPHVALSHPFASLTEADLVATIIAIVKEIERRRHAHDLPPAPPPEPHPPRHPRRRRQSPRGGSKPAVGKKGQP